MNSKITYDKLQPWIEMLIDAVENKGASSSGIANPKVFPYAQKYRDLLAQVRNKELGKYHLGQALGRYKREIQEVSNQTYRTKQLTDALDDYFIKEFMK